MSSSLQPHGLQHMRLPCPSLSPGIRSDSCPVMPSSFFSFCLQAFPASGSYPSESALCIRWPKYWSFSFSISPPSEYSVLISFRMDWLDLLAVQGTLKSLLQHHSSKASALWCSVLWRLTFSYGLVLTSIPDYWKNYSFDNMPFVGKVISLLFNTLSGFGIAFLSKSKHLLFLRNLIILFYCFSSTS